MASKRKTKEEKALDTMIERACSRACQNIQINIFDLTKVDKKAREIHANGGDLDTELRAYVESIRA